MSNLQIYLARNNVQAGPYSLQQVNTMLASGEVDLNDLMWHEGMENWQRVGMMTHDTRRYSPNGSAPSPDNIGSMIHNPTVDPTINNTTPVGKSNRTSVDRLYGRAPTSPQTPNNSDKLKNENPYKTPSSILTKKNVVVNELASVGSRILAVLIDQILALTCLIPLFAALDFSLDKLMDASTDYAAMTALMESLPQHLVAMSSLMFIALLVVQIVMLLKRGQSLGKLITGVRILDINTHKLPGATNLILVRTVLTNLAYNLGFIGVIIALADFSVMLFDKQRRSLHDKLAKTYVVKSQDHQLDYKQKADNKKS